MSHAQHTHDNRILLQVCHLSEFAIFAVQMVHSRLDIVILNQGECCACSAPALQTFICRQLLEPQFWPFSPVGCSITEFFTLLVH